MLSHFVLKCGSFVFTAIIVHYLKTPMEKLEEVHDGMMNKIW